MDFKPEISIIIPVYNVGMYLQKGLNSVVHQTLTNIEIICVNDCSTDNSLSFLKEYAKLDERITIIDLEQNVGQGKARNLALEQAQADYVMFLDPDDWFELDTCEKALSKIKENNNDFVAFDFRYFYEDTLQTKNNQKFSNIFKDYDEKSNINPRTCEKNYFCNAYAWNKIYKKSFLNEHHIRFSETRFAEDSIFFAKVVANAQSFSFIDEVLYTYRQKSANDVTYDFSKHYSLLVKNHKENFDYIKTKENLNLTRNYLIYSIKSVLFWLNEVYKSDSTLHNVYYDEMYKYFTYLNENNDISSIKININYKLFDFILKNPNFNSYKKYLANKKIRDFLCSVKNNGNGKILTILGLKIVLKRG